MAIFDSGINSSDSPTQRARKAILQRRFRDRTVSIPSNSAGSRLASTRNRQTQGYEREIIQEKESTSNENKPKINTRQSFSHFINSIQSDVYGGFKAFASITPVGLAFRGIKDLFTTDVREQALLTQKAEEQIKTESARATAASIKKESELTDFNFLESVFQRGEKPYNDAYLQSLTEQKQSEQLFQRLQDFENFQTEIMQLESQGFPVSTDGLGFQDFISGSAQAKAGLSKSGTDLKTLGLGAAIIVGGLILLNNKSKRR